MASALLSRTEIERQRRVSITSGLLGRLRPSKARVGHGIAPSGKRAASNTQQGDSVTLAISATNETRHYTLDLAD